MGRSSAFARVLAIGYRRAALFGVILAIAAPACAGRSIRTDEDDAEPPPVPPDDDGWYGGGTSSGGSVGRGGFGGTSGSVASGGTFPAGGSFPMGGTIAVGGTIGVGGVTPAGGTSPCGDGAAPGGIPSGTGGAAPPNSDPECKGIKSNFGCVQENKRCPDLICGLGDSGRRECNCATNWTCSACDYTHSPFRQQPCNIPQCPASVADEVPCSQLDAVCGPVGSEYCACYASPTEGLIWDCDKPPSTWGAEPCCG